MKLIQLQTFTGSDRVPKPLENRFFYNFGLDKRSTSAILFCPFHWKPNTMTIEDLELTENSARSR